MLQGLLDKTASWVAGGYLCLRSGWDRVADGVGTSPLVKQCNQLLFRCVTSLYL